MIKNSFYLTLLILVVTGCSQTQKGEMPKKNEKLQTELDKKISKRLDLIDSLKTYQIDKLVPTPQKSMKNKIVTYIDGTCSSCVKELFVWDKLMSEEAFKKFDFIFYIKAYNLKSLAMILKEVEFKHPYKLDLSDAFYTVNKLSDSKSYQSFLINNKDTIVYIGNPIYNEDIKKLYSNYSK